MTNSNLQRLIPLLAFFLFISSIKEISFLNSAPVLSMAHGLLCFVQTLARPTAEYNGCSELWSSMRSASSLGAELSVCGLGQSSSYWVKCFDQWYMNHKYALTSLFDETMNNLDTSENFSLCIARYHKQKSRIRSKSITMHLYKVIWGCGWFFESRENGLENMLRKTRKRSVRMFVFGFNAAFQWAWNCRQQTKIKSNTHKQIMVLVQVNKDEQIVFPNKQCVSMYQTLSV